MTWFKMCTVVWLKEIKIILLWSVIVAICIHSYASYCFIHPTPFSTATTVDSCQRRSFTAENEQLRIKLGCGCESKEGGDTKEMQKQNICLI